MHVIWFDRLLPAEYSGLLQGRARPIRAVPDGHVDRFASLIQAEAIIAGGSTHFSTEVQARAPRLRAICRTGIGTDNIDIEEATRRGIAVCNAPDGPTISTAEHTMALLLSVAKQIPPAQNKLRAGIERDAFNSHDGLELMGLHLGLIGLGRIGRRVARLAAGFEMRVTAFDPQLPDQDFATMEIARSTNLEDLLRKSDVVSLHLPLTARTRHLIDRNCFALMKPGAILINASRGGLVDEAALLDALQSGHLRGAGLDVFEQEPASPDHPLLRLDNVVSTPHVAAATGASKRRLWASAVDQAIDVLEGRRPVHLVNPEVWPRICELLEKS